jgi:hypothetical protein
LIQEQRKGVARKGSSQMLLNDEEIPGLPAGRAESFPYRANFAFAPLPPGSGWDDAVHHKASPVYPSACAACQTFGAFFKSKFLFQSLPRAPLRLSAGLAAFTGRAAFDFSATAHSSTGKYRSRHGAPPAIRPAAARPAHWLAQSSRDRLPLDLIQLSIPPQGVIVVRTWRVSTWLNDAARLWLLSSGRWASSGLAAPPSVPAPTTPDNPSPDIGWPARWSSLPPRASLSPAGPAPSRNSFPRALSPAENAPLSR